MTDVNIWLLVLSFVGGGLAGNIYTARSAMRHMAIREEMLHNTIILFIRAAKELGVEDAFVAKANEHLAANGMGIIRRRSEVKGEDRSVQ